MRRYENKELLTALRHGAVLGILSSLAISIALSVFMTLIDIPKILLCTVCTVMLSCSSYICAHRSTQICRHRGLVQGLITGAGIALPILIISTISLGYISDYCLVKISACMAAGILGGIQGVNTKQTKAK